MECIREAYEEERSTNAAHATTTISSATSQMNYPASFNSHLHRDGVVDTFTDSQGTR